MPFVYAAPQAPDAGSSTSQPAPPAASPEFKMKFPTPENKRWLRRRPYQALDTSAHHIRLLKVCPKAVTVANLEVLFPQWMRTDTDAKQMVNKYRMEQETGDQPLAMSIDQVTYDQGIIASELLSFPVNSVQNQYSAISYCAGDINNTKRMLLDGYLYNCFAHLEHTLQQVRSSWGKIGEDRELLLWTDQICINQHDSTEKSHQVSFMRDIYHLARHVLVCVSIPGKPSNVISRVAVSDKARRYIQQSENVDSISTERGIRKLEKHMKEDWYALQLLVAEIMRQPWWTRS